MFDPCELVPADSDLAPWDVVFGSSHLITHTVFVYWFDAIRIEGRACRGQASAATLDALALGALSRTTRRRGRRRNPRRDTPAGSIRTRGKPSRSAGTTPTHPR